MIRLLVFIIFTFSFPSLRAEVLDSGDSGFVIEIATQTTSTASEAYQQFLKIGQWWDGDHSWFGSADNFYLEPKVGGCFCEVKGDQQAQHMTVSFVDPNSEIRMVGGLGPLQMMGLSGGMSWKFTDNENSQGSTIVHRYAVNGYTKGGLQSLAKIVDSVQTSQVQSLANILATLKKPD